MPRRQGPHWGVLAWLACLAVSGAVLPWFGSAGVIAVHGVWLGIGLVWGAGWTARNWWRGRRA